MRYLSMLMLAVLIVAGPGAGYSQAQTTWDVPAANSDIDYVVNTLASAGDLVRVSNNLVNGVNVPYGALTMKVGVTVYAKDGELPKISGSGADYAVDFPTNATSSTVLEGFAEITGGTSGAIRVRGSGVVRDCVIAYANTGGTDYAVFSTGTTTVDGLTVTVGGTAKCYGIYHTGGAPDIRDCAVTLSETTDLTSAGLVVDAPSATTGGTVSGCSVTLHKGIGLSLLTGAFTVSGITVAYTASDYDNVGMYCGWSTGYSRQTIRDCLVSAPEGVGIFVVDDSVKVQNVTITGVGTGIWGYPGTDVTVRNCIVTDYNDGAEYAFDTVTAEYCIADGNAPYDPSPAAQGTGSVVEDPLFCDAAGGAYTLRIDSYGNPEHNGSGRKIGAFDVACAGGELVRSTTVATNTTVSVTADVTVPSSLSLTLRSGVEFLVEEDDLGAGGSDEELVELIVVGDLVVAGGEDAEDRVALRGATAAVGSWWGIEVASSGSVGMANADVSHAQYPLVVTAADTSYVTGCAFRDYELTGLTIGSGSGLRLLVEDNLFYPSDGALAIQLVSDVDGVRLEDNEIWGDEPMLAGIATYLATGAPRLAGNWVSGFTVSEGIALSGGSADLAANEVTSNFTGILVTGGTPRIGLGSDSDNEIWANEDGVVITGGVPVVRNNRIYDNVSWGVRVQNGADPDLGTSSGSGLNWFEGNYSGCIGNENSGGTPTVRAVGNYFGPCDGGFPEVCWSGNVDVGTWLCTEPASARRPEIAVVGDGSGLVLRGAHPNPTAAGSGIAFRVEGERRVVGARVFDVAGRVVRELMGRSFDAGDHVLVWDGLTEDGRPARTGMYFVRLTAGEAGTGTVKVLVTR